MITLFGSLGSGNVHKVQMILARRDTSFRRVDVAQTRGEPRDPRFLDLNPMGKVPAVLRDDGRVLTESGAILYHFAQSTPLWPECADARAEVLRWMFFEQYSHEPTIAVMRYLLHFAADPNRHVDRVAELAPRARFALEAMESRLGGADWIAADGCTIADIARYPYTRCADSVGIAAAKYPGISRWLARVESEPAFVPLGSESAVEVLSFEEYFGPRSEGG